MLRLLPALLVAVAGLLYIGMRLHRIAPASARALDGVMGRASRLEIGGLVLGLVGGLAYVLLRP